VGKKRIIKRFEHLPEDLLALVKKEYPDGYEDSLITFQTMTGELASGLPLETEDTVYLIRMPKNTVHSDDEEEETTDSSDSQGFESLENLQIADDDEEEEDRPSNDDADDGEL
jgi:DNA-directed RNA polymerase subunit delta